MLKSEIINTLQFYIDAGVYSISDDSAVNFFELSKKKPSVGNLQKAPPKPPVIPDTLNALQSEKSISAVEGVKTAKEIASNVSSLEELKKAVESFEGCSLKAYATHTVFGVGKSENPDVMFVGEAPGADEDRVGTPFVGKAGQLLDKMMASIGLNRSENSYISNIVNWRPPGNRTPTEEEISICLPFIQKHIELVNPKIVICLGGVASKALLKTSDGIAKIRGKEFEYNTGEKTFICIPTFHPSYLLKNPILKKKSWQDLLMIKDKLSK